MSFENQHSSMPSQPQTFYDSPYPEVRFADDGTPFSEMTFVANGGPFREITFVDNGGPFREIAFADNGTPFPEITISPGEDTPTQDSFKSTTFTGRPSPSNTFFHHAAAVSTNTATSTAEANNPFLAASSSSFVTSSSQPPMQMLSSNFASPLAAPRANNSHLVSPRHGSPHAASLSFSEHDRRYWQGFEDGFNAQMAKPEFPVESLPLHVRGNSLGFNGNGGSPGIDASQSSRATTPSALGMFTAPATPLDSEFGNGILSGGNAGESHDQMMNKMYADTIQCLRTLNECIKTNDGRITKLTESITGISQALGNQHQQLRALELEELARRL